MQWTPPEVEPWTEWAACRDTDPDVFFPDKGGTTNPAKAICARCPVTYECLDYAIRSDERWGVWGGLSERQIASLKRHTPRQLPID